MPRASLCISHIDLLTSLWGRFCLYHHNHPQFVDEETEAQSKNVWVTHLVVVQLGLEPRQSDFIIYIPNHYTMLLLKISFELCFTSYL